LPHCFWLKLFSFILHHVLLSESNDCQILWFWVLHQSSSRHWTFFSVRYEVLTAVTIFICLCTASRKNWLHQVFLNSNFKILYLYVCIKCFGMSRFLTSWNEFAEMLIRGTTWWLYYENWVHGMYTKQITIENTHGSTTEQWRSHQQAQRLNCHLEMVHNVTEYTAKFTILSHHCIQMKQIIHNMGNFIFSILLKQKQNSLKTNQTKAVQKKKYDDCTRCYNFTHLLNHINKCTK
jgi:hypothetical protein